MSDRYLDYVIYLTDAKLVQTLQNQRGIIHTGAGDTWVTGIFALPPAAYGCPAAAARKWSAPVIKSTDQFQAPCIQDSKIVTLDQQDYPIDEDHFDRGPGGLWGWVLSLFGGGPVTYHWRGTWQYSIPPVPVDSGGTPIAAPAKISQRKWVDGFEFPDLGEGGSVSSLTVSRASSRHVDGFGFNIRGNQTYKKHNCTEFGATASNKSWERFYIRINKMPSARTGFWRCHNSVSDAAGAQLALNPSGTITVLDTNNVNAVQNIASTVALAVGHWYRIDLAITYSATVPVLKVWLNTALVLNITGFDAGFAGMCRAGNHVSSQLGWEAGMDGDPAVSDLGLDLDDWMCAAQPATFDGLDFLAGSRMVPVLAKNTAVANAWTGEWRSQILHPALNTGPWMESSTSAERLALEMAGGVAIDSIASGGCVAIVFGIYTSRAGTGDGEIGYAIAGGTPVMTPMVAQSSTVKWHTVMYRPTGLPSPQPVTPLEFHHTKTATTDTAKSFLATAVAEVLGIFGGEDVRPLSDGTSPDAPAIGTGIHNAPYPSTSWAKANGSPPEAPVVIVGGTYAGNDTSQDLIFRIPVCWIFIRRVDNTNNFGTSWWSSMMAAHRHFVEGQRPQGMAQALIDPDFLGDPTGTQTQLQRTLLRITSDADDVNKSGETYQYVAFCDPGMRFALNFALANHRGTVDRVTRLVNSAFTPIGLWLHRETLGGSTATQQWYKGPGHAGSHASKLSAAETDSIASLTAGQVTSKTNIQTAGPQEIACAAFRLDDGSADVGIPNVLWIGTYTGDGTGNRTITCRASSTKYPMWAIVVPHNAAAVYRDPSHTTTTSTTVPAVANPSNGIRGGDIGKLLVGSDLNANGIVYDYFVIGGDGVACNNGFSCNGEIVPVVPVPPPQPGPWPTPIPVPIPPPTPGPNPNPLPVPVPAPFTGPCKPLSTNLVNIALARVGISKPIVDVDAERSPEVSLAFSVFTECVEATLRDHPWPWATSTRLLILAGGDGTTPITTDWLYAYNVPTDCVFARRLVKTRGAAVDPTPPPFALSSDADGELLYTNEVDAILEYTSSPGCAAKTQDPLFREALICKLAMTIAPALSRIPTAVADAQKAYDAAIAKAATVVRPGAPGLPDAAAVGPDDLSTAEKLAVVNLALLQIGLQTIPSLDCPCREGKEVRNIYEHELRATLRDFTWPFARRYADLELVGGTIDAPVNDDFTYSYRLPDDCLAVRRVVRPGIGRAFDHDPPQYILGSDDDGALLFSSDNFADAGDDESVTIEYTARLDDILLVADSLFTEAFAWRLSYKLAPSLAQADPLKAEQLGRGPLQAPESQAKERPATRQQLAAQLAANAWVMYTQTLSKARVAAMNEQQPTLEQGDADWIRDRN